MFREYNSLYPDVVAEQSLKNACFLAYNSSLPPVLIASDFLGCFFNIFMRTEALPRVSLYLPPEWMPTIDVYADLWRKSVLQWKNSNEVRYLILGSSST